MDAIDGAVDIIVGAEQACEVEAALTFVEAEELDGFIVFFVTFVELQPSRRVTDTEAGRAANVETGPECSRGVVGGGSILQRTSLGVDISRISGRAHGRGHCKSSDYCSADSELSQECPDEYAKVTLRT